MPRPPRPVGHVVQVSEQTRALIAQRAEAIAQAERELLDTIDAERDALRLTIDAAAEILDVSVPTLNRRLKRRRDERGRTDEGGGEA